MINPTSGGVLPKQWITIDSVEYLVKGNSEDGLESVYEVLASRIGKYLGFNVVEYELIENKNQFSMFGKYLCICRKFPVKTYRFYSHMESLEKDSRWLDLKSSELMESIVASLGVNFMYNLSTLLVFDFIIGNCDRHLNNVEVMYTGNEELVLTQYLDFGKSLLSSVGDDAIMSGHYLNYDVSQPVEPTHKEQLNTIFEYIDVKRLPFNFMTIKSNELTRFMSSQTDLISIIGDQRFKAITSYVEYRFKYIKQVLNLN